MSSRGMPITKQIKRERRQRAEKMQEEYDKLSVEQKLAKLPPPPGAARQRARLESKLTGSKNDTVSKVDTEPSSKEKKVKTKTSKAKTKE